MTVGKAVTKDCWSHDCCEKIIQKMFNLVTQHESGLAQALNSGKKTCNTLSSKEVSGVSNRAMKCFIYHTKHCKFTGVTPDQFQHYVKKASPGPYVDIGEASECMHSLM